ncbi:MAG: acyltransferase family protein [bacterium]
MRPDGAVISPAVAPADAAPAAARAMHYPKLDSVRCYAAFAVVFAHIFQIWTWSPTTEELFPLGNLGVIVFFVLSGFLITSLLLNESDDIPLRRSFKNFYMRRTLRIFPIYYLYLIVAFSIDLDGIGATGVWSWLYLTNLYFFWHNSWLLSNSHLWSLAVEEQFYLAWPFIVLLLRRRPRALAAIFGAICALALLARLHLLQSGYSGSPQITVFTLCALDYLALGGLLALAQRRFGERIAGFGLPLLLGAAALYWASAALMHAVPTTAPLFWTLGKFALGLIGVGAVLYSIHSRARTTPLHNPLTMHLGKISYGIYLYHNPLVAYYKPILALVGIDPGDSLAAKVLCCVVLVVLAAEISYALIERPLLRLKERFR